VWRSVVEAQVAHSSERVEHAVAVDVAADTRRALAARDDGGDAHVGAQRGRRLWRYAAARHQRQLDSKGSARTRGFVEQ
jgi:hypothetical protein